MCANNREDTYNKLFRSDKIFIKMNDKLHGTLPF